MATHYAGTKEEQRALNSYIKLSRGPAEAVSSTINGHLYNKGLTLSQFGVLEALYHLGPMSVGHLGDKILRSSGNMTMVVDNLVKRGLVSRQRSQEDRRRVTVKLTPEGEKLVRSIWPRHLQGVVEAFSVLSADEQEQLAFLCRKVGIGQATVNIPEEVPESV